MRGFGGVESFIDLRASSHTIMTPEEYKWTINLVKDKHFRFNLTFEQAEKVYQFEQEKDLYSEEYYFSVWEDYDYVLDNFRIILNDKQFKKFVGWHKDNIKRHEEFLIESDKEQTKYIDYHNELIDFYEQIYVPDFYKENFLIQSVSLSVKSKSKVSFLKHEYKSFLDSQKIGFVSSHYRDNKLFKPNELKATLLRHKLSYIVPRFFFLKIKMDEPTKAIAKFLLDTFHYIPQQYEDFFKRKDEELSLLAEELRIKHIGEIKGWHKTITETEQQRKENQIMQVILMDREKYGC